MSKDEALQKWLDAEVPEDQCGSAFNPSIRAPAEPFREIAAAAWHAAVAHTLAHVAGELSKRADDPVGLTVSAADFVHNLAAGIERMEP